MAEAVLYVHCESFPERAGAGAGLSEQALSAADFIIVDNGPGKPWPMATPARLPGFPGRYRLW